MNSKKIFSIFLLASASILLTGVVLAAPVSRTVYRTGNAAAAKVTTVANKVATVKYTAQQQACINAKQQSIIKPAQDAFNAAVPNALKVKQAAIKAATDKLNKAAPAANKTKEDAIKSAADALANATTTATQTRQAAIKAAQQITDAAAKAAAIKSANDAYNNDATVKAAKIPYMAAIKAANDAFNNDPIVQKAKVPYLAAIKAANDAFNNDASVKQVIAPYKAAQKAAREEAIKECTTTTTNPIVSGGTSFFQGFGDIVSGMYSSIINAFKLPFLR